MSIVTQTKKFIKAPLNFITDRLAKQIRRLPQNYKSKVYTAINLTFSFTGVLSYFLMLFDLPLSFFDMSQVFMIFNYAVSLKLIFLVLTPIAVIGALLFTALFEWPAIKNKIPKLIEQQAEAEITIKQVSELGINLKALIVLLNTTSPVKHPSLKNYLITIITAGVSCFVLPFTFLSFFNFSLFTFVTPINIAISLSILASFTFVWSLMCFAELVVKNDLKQNKKTTTKFIADIRAFNAGALAEKCKTPMPGSQPVPLDDYTQQNEQQTAEKIKELKTILYTKLSDSSLVSTSEAISKSDNSIRP